VQTPSKYGYQDEALGEEVITRLIERYLAGHRPLLREHREAHKVLLDILDEFVRVGWPRAHRLVYRLDEILQVTPTGRFYVDLREELRSSIRR
jgi:hypothetical protein